MQSAVFLTCHISCRACIEQPHPIGNAHLRAKFGVVPRFYLRGSRILTIFAPANKVTPRLTPTTTIKMENNKEQKLQIQLRPEMADGKYSNLAMIGHGPNEFLIDFIFAAPGMPQAPVVSRVMMTPENAKQLLFALSDNVKKYETTFGEIKPRTNGNPNAN